jgi:hypothetical protein
MFQSFSFFIRSLIFGFVISVTSTLPFSYAEESAVGETTTTETTTTTTETTPTTEPAAEPPVEGVFETPTEKNTTVAPADSPAEAPAPEVSSDADVLGMELPPISAKTYDLKVERPSLSKRMYLFQKSTSAMPDIGRIFLLRDGPTAVMGFRVVKIYPEKKQIAAKKVKDYPNFLELPAGSTYKAFEKMGAITSVPENTPEDLTDLNELEGGSAPDPQATPTDGTGEMPLSGGVEGGAPVATLSDAPSMTGSDDEEGEDSGESSEEEFAANMMGFDVGSYRGVNLPGGASTMGFGLNYSRLLTTARTGSLAAEVGIAYYKNSGDIKSPETGEITSQSFTLTPLSGRLRYHFSLIDEKWSYYIYGGGIFNRVSSQFGATTEEVALVEKMIVGVGAGVFIPTGPNWYMKLNLGTDWIGFGLALRF